MSLTLTKVDYSYHNGTALKTDALFGIDLTMSPGEFAGLMGPAGCGKSTLLLTAAGLLSPARGTVSADGTVGMVFQNPDHQLFETMLEREIAFAPKCQGLTGDELRERVDEALRAVGLDAPELRERSPFTLSGGEKRRAALAGVLAMAPRYLLLDEPLAGLDPGGTQALLDCLHELCRKGTAVLMAAHDPDILCEHAGRVIRMEKGQIVSDGTAREFFSAERDPDSIRPELGNVRETVCRLRAAGFPLPDGITRFAELSAALRSEMTKRSRNV